VGATSYNSDNNGFGMSSTGGVLYATTTAGRAVIFNRRSSDGEIINLRKDGFSVGSIGSASSLYLYLTNGDTGLKFVSADDSIRPADGGNDRDNAIDLGTSGGRFKDLYLSGGVYLGGTGTANKLDDYEEGSWTPVITNGITSPTYSVQSATYTKVGNLVSFAFRVNLSAGTADANRVIIGGLPFTSDSNVNGSNGSAMLAFSTGVFDTTEATGFYIPGNTTVVEFYDRDGTSFTGTQVNTPSAFNVNIVGFYYTAS
jgi:hypothetical protein